MNQFLDTGDKTGQYPNPTRPLAKVKYHLKSSNAGGAGALLERESASNVIRFCKNLKTERTLKQYA